MVNATRRFVAKIGNGGTGRCWEWTGATSKPGGYGAFKYKGRRVQAHRFAYEAWRGPIPPGVCVCHRCDNRTCVNPEHLFLGTQAENNADMAAKGRSTIGVRNPHARLSAADVLAIRRSYLPRVVTMRALARSYGVNEATIWRVIHRVCWDHL